jgi:hypothetical protein
VGDTLPDLVVLQVLRADGSPAKGVTVQWTVTGGGGELVAAGGYTNATGRAYARWRLGSVAGPQALTAQTDGAGSVAFGARGLPHDRRLEAVAGGGQAGPADGVLPQPVVVRLVQPTGAAVGGARVTWTVVSGGGSLDSAVSLTGTDGHAARRWRLGGVPGEQRLRATFRGLPPVEFTAAMALPGAAVGIESGGGQTGTQYDTLTQPLVVRVAQPDGTPLPGVAVSWTTTAQYAGLRHARTTTDSTGRATNAWRVGKPLGTQTATASVPGVGSATFSAAVVLNGRTLTPVSGGGQQGQPGDTLQPLAMRAVDGTGRGIRGVKVLWSGVNGAMVDSAVTFTDVNGVARTRWILGSRLQGQEVRAAVVNSGEVKFTAAVQPVTGPQIVYRSNRAGGNALFLVSPDGTRRYPIYSGVPSAEPDWSPDGSQIVFSHASSGWIWLMNADGSNARALTPGSKPAWSPLGDRIAFNGTGTGGTGVYVVGVDGTGRTLLRAGAYDPLWSPDGRRIAFRSAQGSMIMNADGSNPQPFMTGNDPSWSPDGTRIVSWSPDGNCDCHIGIMTVSPLVPGAPGGTVGGGNEPDWSHDGTQIVSVLYGVYNRYHSLMVMDADGSNRRVLDGPHNIYTPAWKPMP